LLDAGPGRVLVHVTLRHAASSIGIAALWTIIVAAGEMTVTDLFKIRTYAEEFYTAFVLRRELMQAVGDVLPGVLLTALLTLAGLAICGRLLPVARQQQPRPAWIFSLGLRRRVATLIVVLLLLLIAGVPLAGL